MFLPAVQEAWVEQTLLVTRWNNDTWWKELQKLILKYAISSK